MSTRPNTRHRLAPRTSTHQCARCAQDRSIAVLSIIQKTSDRTSPGHRLTVFHRQRRKIGPKNLAPIAQVLFKIHNPI
jgi:hypothetical protein